MDMRPCASAMIVRLSRPGCGERWKDPGKIQLYAGGAAIGSGEVNRDRVKAHLAPGTMHMGYLRVGMSPCGITKGLGLLHPPPCGSLPVSGSAQPNPILLNLCTVRRILNPVRRIPNPVRHTPNQGWCSGNPCRYKLNPVWCTTGLVPYNPNLCRRDLNPCPCILNPVRCNMNPCRCNLNPCRCNLNPCRHIPNPVRHILNPCRRKNGCHQRKRRRARKPRINISNSAAPTQRQGAPCHSRRSTVRASVVTTLSETAAAVRCRCCMLSTKVC